jgi:cytosine/adenosine deaminase-related metal-dependent hydrolase
VNFPDDTSLVHVAASKMLATFIFLRSPLPTATRNPAAFMNKDDSYGTIQKNRIADLVLLNANPLDDIKNTRSVNAVVVNGKLLDRAALDRMLQNARAAAANIQ